VVAPNSVIIRIAVPNKEELKKLLKYATEETLKKYLKKAEKEFIPGGKKQVETFNCRYY
jgi:predicted HicB family RNase H-like nuclease